MVGVRRELHPCILKQRVGTQHGTSLAMCRGLGAKEGVQGKGGQPGQYWAISPFSLYPLPHPESLARGWAGLVPCCVSVLCFGSRECSWSDCYLTQPCAKDSVRQEPLQLYSSGTT